MKAFVRNSLEFAIGVAIVSLVFFLALSMRSVNASASPTSNVVANVAVGNVIYLSISPNAIYIGSFTPPFSTDTNTQVTDNDVGGNLAANILVEGTDWVNASTSNTFGVSNTVWSASPQSSYTGTPLTSSFVVTNIVVPQPTLNSPTTTNNIYFGVNIPGGLVAGNYLETVSFENENTTTTPTTYNSSSTANSVVLKINIQSVCYISLSPSTISFGSLVAATQHATNVLVTDYDPNGNAAATVSVYGGNWIGPTSFGVSNTTWSAGSLGSFGGTALTSTPTSTGITIPAPTTSQETTSNSIYFGVNVPGGTPNGIYTQNIIIENSC